MSAFRWQAVIAGVGGQGVLFATRILARAAQNRTDNVFISEVHGMAQRGGSVLSHLKAGNFASPLVAAGWAETLFALESGEAIRNLGFLAEGANLVVNAPDQTFLSREAREILQHFNIKTLAVPAADIAHDQGVPKAANVVLLGAAAAAGALPFSFEELLGVLEDVTTAARRELNTKLFELGADSGN